MRRKLTEPKIFETTCKRCGKTIYASPRAFEYRLGRICKECITPEESQEILEYQADRIIRRTQRNPLEPRICPHCGAKISTPGSTVLLWCPKCDKKIDEPWEWRKGWPKGGKRNPMRQLTAYNKFIQTSMPYYTSQGMSVPDAMRASAHDWHYLKRGQTNPTKGKYQTLGYAVLGGLVLYFLYKKFIEKKI